jgi:very-short-patch-repair endonuclease
MRRNVGLTPAGARTGRAGAELRLWSLLEGFNRSGYHFRRQAPFAGFLIDFVEHDILLAIDLTDGDARPTPAIARDHVLKEAGYTVLRLKATDIAEDFADVAATLKHVLEDRPAPAPPAQ